MTSSSAARLGTVLLGTLVLAAVSLAEIRRGDPESPTLRFTFVGNMAVHITDGDTVLITDFPYESGAFGYMKWSAEAVPPVKGGLALVTHRHRDHFAPELLGPYDLTVAGPSEVLRLVKDRPTLPLAGPARYRSLEIEPRPTPHASVEHLSYLVSWHGRRLYFSGDTESSADLLTVPDLDVAFVSPWLFTSVRKQGARIDARRVVIYHHEDGEAVAGEASERTVPRQGDAFAVAGRPPRGPKATALGLWGWRVAQSKMVGRP